MPEDPTPDDPAAEPAVEPIQKIIDECKAATRIRYLYGDSFFTPAGGINHRELGYSSTISSPVTVALEWLYAGYKKVRDDLAALDSALFPHKSPLCCHRADSRLVGQLVFADGRRPGAPMHHVRVEFWGRTYWGAWRKLAVGRTDADGNFSLSFELRQARNWFTRRLRFEIYRVAGIDFDDHASPQTLETVFRAVPVPPSELIGMAYNLRQIIVPYWEYRADTKIPRAVVPENYEKASELYANGRIDALKQQILPIELTRARHLEQIAIAPDTISIASIQADYPENLTVAIEKRLPGYTRGDDWFGERMMNGMNRGCFSPDPETPDRWWIRYFGNCDYDHNDVYALPNAEIQFRLKENGLPLPTQIRLTGPLNAFEKDPAQSRTLTPDDGALWDAAKRLARISGSVCTEIDEHFTGTHLNAEQYALAAFRNLRVSPIAALLLPHLKEVSLIDHTADKLLLQEFLTQATALTGDGIARRTFDILGMQDWYNWSPMPVLSDAHTVAQADRLFWEIVGQYVERFVDEHATAIRQEWLEVLRFSDDLVLHSVPVFGSTEREKDRPWLAERREYYEALYRFDPDAPRVRIDGELKTVTPITSAATFDEAGPHDWQNLKDACRYAIFVATYLHTWINEHQYDDLGEILYNCGGLRFGESELGVLGPESDLDIAPDRTVGTGTLFFTNLLSRTEYGFITRNEEGDVNPLFSRLLEQNREQFKKYSVDIDAIESRTNI